MNILGFCGIAFLIIMSFVATSNLIFGINNFLLPNKHKKIKISQKKLKLLHPFIFKKIQKGTNSENEIFNLVYVLSITTYIIYLTFTISFILLCVFYSATDCIKKAITIFFLVCFILVFIFCCVIATIYEVEKKRYKKREKSNEMNFK